MLVSVIIPAFNVAGCLDRAIDSVLAQTIADFEIIVVDDASCDTTADLVRRRAAEDSRIRLLQNPTNCGPSVARNRGIAAALGEWVAILDADDAYEPDRLAVLCAIGEARQAALVADNLVLYDTAAGLRIGVGLEDRSEDAVEIISVEDFLRNCITGRSPFDLGQLKGLMRRDFLREHALRYADDLRHGEDFDLYARLLLAGGRFVLVGKSYYLFTQRVGTVSAKPSGFSRTIANYDGMRNATLALLSHPAVRGNAVREDLLRARADAIRWHKSGTILRGLLQSRDVPGLLRACLRDWRIGAVLVRKLVGRLHRTTFASSMQSALIAAVAVTLLDST